VARVRLASPLRYASFHAPFLARLGISRAELIDSLPTSYPQTRRWAQAAHLRCPDAQATGYGSRRDDAARCLTHPSTCWKLNRSRLARGGGKC
jgi:hypothetical protein